MRYVLLFVPFLLLSACATLSENECIGGDWFGIGVEDGADGRASDFIFEHAKACNEFGVRPNRTKWLQGREDGLRQYCTPARAFDEGRRGRRLSPVCPAEQLSTLSDANSRGLRIHRIEDEIREIERDIRAINLELSTLEVNDPRRSSLAAERSFLRLDLLGLRATRARLL